MRVSYGNQALILKAWGRLEEALALHKKEEAICLELGKKADLGYCHWNWGLLLRALGDSVGELEKLSAAFALFQELGMPLQRDAVEAELARTRQASAEVSRVLSETRARLAFRESWQGWAPRSRSCSLRIFARPARASPITSAVASGP